MRIIVSTLLVIALVYLTLGLGFHLRWTSALDACREAQTDSGEFVEPEVYGNALGVIFDVTYWPVYARANLHHFGVTFGTPCDRS